MSRYYFLYCEEDHSMVRTGQGYEKIESFYSSKSWSEAYEVFLNETAGKSLRLIEDYTEEEIVYGKGDGAKNPAREYPSPALDHRHPTKRED